MTMDMHTLNLEAPSAPAPAIDDPLLDASQQPPMPAKNSKPVPTLPIVIVMMTILGVATGFALNSLMMKKSTIAGGPAAPMAQVAGSNVKEGDVFGSADTASFKDSAEGYLEVAPPDAEGSHHLARLGGISQTVNLTSSVTDLTKLEGMNVRVWGETFKAQKAGWLMDVGRIEVLKNPGEKPK